MSGGSPERFSMTSPSRMEVSAWQNTQALAGQMGEFRSDLVRLKELFNILP